MNMKKGNIKKLSLKKNCETLCVSVERYMQSHTYMDIMRSAQIEGITLTGFTQSMCSMMKKGKSCVKNPETVGRLINFLNI
jgi:DNA-binding SARP family transcriptional activator